MRGETVSHYRIIDELGVGGMGIVYRAEDVRLGRMVAVKFLPLSSVKDEHAIVRFQREARTASSLNHPGICTIYDIGERDGQPFIAMELLEGQTLRELLESRTLKLTEALDLAIQIADALEAAHSQNILHRDIKPANVFVTRRGQAKILDFGLAKLAADQNPASEHPATAATTIHATRSGTTVGTIAYMSPEQARAEPLDARSDLFSFGAVLYEMLTGSLAFSGQSTAIVFDAILNRPPQPVRAFHADLPVDLERIVEKALEKDRDLRYQSAPDLKADLQRLRRDMRSTGVFSPLDASTATMAVPTQAVAGSGLGVFVPSSLDSVQKPVKLIIAGAVGLVVATLAIGTYLTRGPSSDMPGPESSPVAAMSVPGVASTSGRADIELEPPAEPPPPEPEVRGTRRAEPREPRAASASAPTRPAPAPDPAPPTAPAPDAAGVRDLAVARSKIDASLYDQALQDLRVIVDEYAGTEVAADGYFLIAQTFERQGEIDDALAAYIEVHSRFGQTERAAEALFRQANLTLKSRRRDRDQEARQLFGRLAEEHGDTQWAAVGLVTKASLEEDKNIREPDPEGGGVVPAALTTYRLIAERYPDRAEGALWKLGDIYDDLERYTVAVRTFTDLATRFPDTSHDAWYRVGELYERRLEDREKALAAYQQIPPTSPRYRDARQRIDRLSR